MRSSSARSIAISVFCIFIAGCSTAPTKTVAETRLKPATNVVAAPYSDFYLLWRWERAEHHNHIEVLTVFAERGSPIGFRRSGGHLYAVAGTSTRPLIEGRYTWQTLPGRRLPELTPEQFEAQAERDRRAAAIFDSISDFIADSIDDSLEDYLDDGVHHGHDSHDRRPDRDHSSRDRDHRERSPHENPPTSRPAEKTGV
jgi:hypothetical protein